MGRQAERGPDQCPTQRCLVLALKNNVDIFVASEVFEQVQDVSKMTGELEGNLAGMSLGELDIEFRGGPGESGEAGEEEPQGGSRGRSIGMRTERKTMTEKTRRVP